MKNKLNRQFWTAMGQAVLGREITLTESVIPRKLLSLLQQPPPVPSDSLKMQGENLPDRKGRYIYTTTWSILSELGFSRPFRLNYMGSMEILLPFCRSELAVTPQGFQQRVPGDLRALALVGKSAVLRASGIHMVVCSAVYNPEIWGIIEQGKCSICTPDRLRQLVTTLDFSH